MAPTILVARIALMSPDSTTAPTITHISGLDFGTQQGSGRSRDSATGEEEGANNPKYEVGVATQPFEVKEIV